MLAFAAVVIGTNGLLGLASPALARGLSPQTATRLISLVGFLTTLAAGFVLTVVCFGFLAQIPDVAAAGAWSAASLGANEPVPIAVGVLALAAVLMAAGNAVQRAGRVGRDLSTSVAACRRLPSTPGPLVIISDGHADAYALPGLLGGRIILTSAMADALADDELVAVLEHERSHLRHRHHLYLLLVDLSAAANPLLRRLRRVVRLSAERWADEDAARSTGDRHLTARAVARAALAANGSPGPRGAALAVGDHAVKLRAQALLVPATETRPRIVALVAIALVAALAATVQVAHQTERRFEGAHVAYVATGPG